MEIGASLAGIELLVGNPEAAASFYRTTFGLVPEKEGHALACSAPGRALRFSKGPSGQLRRASFRFASDKSFSAHRTAVIEREVALLEDEPGAFTVMDPEGRQIQFLAPAPPAAPRSDALPPARLQHFGVRSPAAVELVDFYVGKLGFVLSDRVIDKNGDLTAAFLRTDAEHHSMAIFRAPQVRFDHFSCETAGWTELREWADHMASVGVDLAWGVGRHGPGNDTFLMVQDPEGNLAEVSSDLEVCGPERPTGVWEHRPQTLNQWGVAIMRS
ncbi:VOC family protein [Roseateles sp. SL47]|uniref:VOC family protein n=1 Tax=Roseateles sp. SL47 TaxID=2995138 RepID=UPI002271AD52|nr:VOC family protein [Roseateles sp. SL47]WAC74615.1 VOC family protein [Roseateles sp. SL47]